LVYQSAAYDLQYINNEHTIQLLQALKFYPTN
jgi:hypothetical protein